LVDGRGLAARRPLASFPSENPRLKPRLGMGRQHRIPDLWCPRL